MRPALHPVPFVQSVSVEMGVAKAFGMTLIKETSPDSAEGPLRPKRESPAGCVPRSPPVFGPLGRDRLGALISRQTHGKGVCVRCQFSNSLSSLTQGVGATAPGAPLRLRGAPRSTVNRALGWQERGAHPPERAANFLFSYARDIKKGIDSSSEIILSNSVEKMKDQFDEVPQEVEQKSQETDNKNVHEIRGSTQKIQHPSNSFQAEPPKGE